MFPDQEPGGRGPRPEEPPSKLINFWVGSSGVVLFLRVLDLETTQQRTPPGGEGTGTPSHGLLTRHYLYVMTLESVLSSLLTLLSHGPLVIDTLESLTPHTTCLIRHGSRSHGPLVTDYLESLTPHKTLLTRHDSRFSALKSLDSPESRTPRHGLSRVSDPSHDIAYTS